MWASSKVAFVRPIALNETIERVSGVLSITEKQPGWDAHRAISPGEPLLFRFSALTFNSHRMHYDLAYSARVEGYRELVVHGPLIATLLLRLAAQQLGDNCLKMFDFCGVSPAICGEMLQLVMHSNSGVVELSAYASDGREVMHGGGSI